MQARTRPSSATPEFPLDHLLANLPGPKNEAFRYTRLSRLMLDRTPSFVSKVGDEVAKLDAGAGVFCQTRSDQEGCRIIRAPESLKQLGVTLCGVDSPILGGRFKRGPEALGTEDVFARLALERGKSGIVLYVPKGVILETPLHFVHWLANGCFFDRTLVVLDEGAQVSIVDEWAGDGARYLAESGAQASPISSALIEFKLGVGAKLNYTLIHDFGHEVQSFFRTSATLDAKSELTQTTLASGGSLTQIRSVVSHEGSDSKSHYLGVARGVGSQSFDFWSEARHLTLNSHSETDVKTVMADQSTAIFNGLIRIDEAASGSTAHQKSRGLLLSEKAQSFAIPKLEINTDDVQCSHGATVSSIGEDELFYLESRGLDRDEAVNLVVTGLLSPALDRIPNAVIQGRMQSKWFPEGPGIIGGHVQ